MSAEWIDPTVVPFVSVVMPCLNEEAAVGQCVRSALAAIAQSAVQGEVIVVDNGSTDRSAEVAAAAGAAVLHEPVRGYGSACLTGLRAARGDILVIGDADLTYDFAELPALLAPLHQGCDLVLGTRFKGGMKPRAMPFYRYYVGNPLLRLMLNRLFGLHLSDVNTGMRAFSREAFQRMELRAAGMEFALEMLIKAQRARLRLCEVPISYYPRTGESKLRPWADGWRHITFMLLYSPTALFLTPGLVMLVAGLAALALLVNGPIWIGGRIFDYHYMFIASLAAIAGNQVMLLGLIVRSYAVIEHFDPPDWIIGQFLRWFTPARGLVAGSAFIVLGLLVFVRILIIWLASGFAALDEIRAGLVGLTLVVLGLQAVFTSALLRFVLLPRA